MSKPRFLCDEMVPAALTQALRQKAPGIDVLCVGEPGAPPLHTLDPDLLLAAEALGRFLLTFDKKSMKGHLADHFAAGHHTWGVGLMREGCTLARYLDEILLIWGATEADEWVDVTIYIP
jgi:hypothetical protein